MEEGEEENRNIDENEKSEDLLIHIKNKRKSYFIIKRLMDIIGSIFWVAIIITFIYYYCSLDENRRT
ncbi:hypothetical protein [Jeotgalibaca porci]|uniref:hypothetical protein n=1 Tax=Jeotgalibaca porci TaxID=1868793 RepID=UPI0035A16FCA